MFFSLECYDHCFEFLISCGTAPAQVEVVSALVQQFETMRMFKKSLVAVASWENPQKGWLVVGLEQFLFFHIVGMSSSQLTNIFQRGRHTTN